MNDWFNRNTILVSVFFTTIMWLSFISELIFMHKFSWVFFPQAILWSLILSFDFYQKLSKTKKQPKKEKEKKSTDDIFNKFNSTL